MRDWGSIQRAVCFCGNFPPVLLDPSSFPQSEMQTAGWIWTVGMRATDQKWLNLKSKDLKIHWSRCTNLGLLVLELLIKGEKLACVWLSHWQSVSGLHSQMLSRVYSTHVLQSHPLLTIAMTTLSTFLAIYCLWNLKFSFQWNDHVKRSEITCIIR